MQGFDATWHLLAVEIEAGTDQLVSQGRLPGMTSADLPPVPQPTSCATLESGAPASVMVRLEPDDDGRMRRVVQWCSRHGSAVACGAQCLD